MRDARNIARHLVRLGYDSESPEESVLVCPLRLQKLLYYCQGWSLALLGRRLFHQDIEAWVKGPVVRDVYDLFPHRSAGITPDVAGELTETLTETEAALVETVYRRYAGHTPRELVDMTHREPAWQEARAGLPESTPSTNRLSPATMEDYFRRQAQDWRAKWAAHGLPVPDPAELWQQDEAWERAGKPVHTAGNFAEFRRLVADR